MYTWMDTWKNEWIREWTHEWIHEWIHGKMNGYMNGYMESVQLAGWLCRNTCYLRHRRRLLAVQEHVQEYGCRAVLTA